LSRFDLSPLDQIAGLSAKDGFLGKGSGIPVCIGI
jgi:hypothetical protein